MLFERSLTNTKHDKKEYMYCKCKVIFHLFFLSRPKPFLIGIYDYNKHYKKFVTFEDFSTTGSNGILR